MLTTRISIGFWLRIKLDVGVCDVMWRNMTNSDIINVVIGKRLCTFEKYNFSTFYLYAYLWDANQ